jgi:CTP synthase (UTP-ammonia lyase)
MGRRSCDRSYRRSRPKELHALATDAALEDLRVPFEWIATDEVRARRWDEIEGLSGMLIAPSTPYRDTEGALEAIRHARERDVPLVGT